MGERLAGLVVVVTGASGIAAAGARRFVAEGASVGIVSRDAAKTEVLAASIAKAGGRVEWAAADLRDEGATVAAFEALRTAFGRFDGLFAVAGGSGRRFGDGPIHEIPLEGWQETLDMNGTPAFMAAREVVRVMLDTPAREGGGRGSIVLVSSVLASHQSPRLFATHAYAAIKGAEVALARTMAAYYAPHGIRVNAVEPGLVATPMSNRAAADPLTSAYAAAKQPLAGGFLAPEAVADAALFLLSDEAGQVTGQSLAVDGGWSVTEAAG
jgi:NAD(P)-dependent dehydrogenase (short-subunit alcohol dehydrogenase family)